VHHEVVVVSRVALPPFVTAVQTDRPEDVTVVDGNDDGQHYSSPPANRNIAYSPSSSMGKRFFLRFFIHGKFLKVICNGFSQN